MNPNTRTIINLNTWERRSSYEFYRNFINPQASITAEVECSDAYKHAKANGISFFRKYVYAILRSVNEIPELKYRIEEEDGVENVVLYEHVSLLTPINVGPNGLFTTIKVPYHLTFEKFNAVMDGIISKIDKENPEPYYAETDDRQKGHCDTVLVSALPQLHFTSVSPTQSCKWGSRKPIITVGKAVSDNGKMMMPIAIAFHHGLCDGYHIGKFFSLVEEYLKGL